MLNIESSFFILCIFIPAVHIHPKYVKHMDNTKIIDAKVDKLLYPVSLLNVAPIMIEPNGTKISKANIFQLSIFNSFIIVYQCLFYNILDVLL